MADRLWRPQDDHRAARPHYLDQINAYDDAGISFGPCHWSMSGATARPHEAIELGGLAAYFRYLDEEKAIAGADVFRAQGLSHLFYIKDKIVFPTSDILKIYKNAKDAVASKKIKDPAAWQLALRNALIAQMIKRDADYKRDSRRILYPTWLPPHPDEAEDLKPAADDPVRPNNERDYALDPRLGRTSRKPGSFKLASIKYDPS